MGNPLALRVPNIARSRPLVVSAVLNSTGGGMLLAFLLVYFDRTTDVGLATIGVAISAGRAVAALVPAFVGRVLDRVGPRQLAIIGDALTAAGFLMCVVARDALLIAVSQVLVQAGSHMFWTSSRGLVKLAAGRESPQTWFGLIGSVRNAGLGVGTLVSALVFTTRSTTLLHGTVVVCAAFFLASCVVLHGWRPAPVEARTTAAADRPAAASGYRAVLGDRRYRGLLVLNLGLVLAAMVIPLVIVVYTVEHVGLTPLFAGGLVVANTVVVALLSTHVSAWSERWGAVRNVRASYVLNLGAFALFWSAVLLPGSPVAAACVLAAAMAVYSAAEILSTPASNVLSVALAPEHDNGHHMAAFQMTWSIGMTLAPAVFGWLLSSSVHATWIALVVLTLVLGALGARQCTTSPKESETHERNDTPEPARH